MVRPGGWILSNLGLCPHWIPCRSIASAGVLVCRALVLVLPCFSGAGASWCVWCGVVMGMVCGVVNMLCRLRRCGVGVCVVRFCRADRIGIERGSACFLRWSWVDGQRFGMGWMGVVSPDAPEVYMYIPLLKRGSP